MALTRDRQEIATGLAWTSRKVAVQVYTAVEYSSNKSFWCTGGWGGWVADVAGVLWALTYTFNDIYNICVLREGAL